MFLNQLNLSFSQANNKKNEQIFKGHKHDQ